MTIQDPHTETVKTTSRYWRLWAIGAAIGLVLAVVSAGITTAATECGEEDGSTNFACHWDADSQGNGLGDDFISVGYGRLVIQLG